MFSLPYSRYIIYPIPWYSFLIVLGAAFAVFLADREAKRCGLPKDTIVDLALWILPFGIIGARIYYVVFSWDQFRDNLLSVFRIWEGGIAIYGAVIAGFIVLLLFCRKRKLPPLLLCDLIVPGLVLAQAVGRWGNYFNIEAYGVSVNNPAFCFFPLAVEVPVSAGTEWHLATFFYESAWDFCIFLFLIILRRKIPKRNGDLFFIYLILYAAGRLVIEEFRTDSLYAGSSVRVSQLLSVVLCAAVLIRFLLIVLRKGTLSRPVHLLILPCVLIYSVLVLAYSLFGLFFSEAGLMQRFLFLFGYSAISCLCFFFLYTASLREEFHAHD